jgi:hypothetical protein
MASLFGLGAFNTQIGQRIARATDNGASAGDLHLHLEICDVINESSDGPKEAVAALKKRLSGSGKNYHQINLALTVLETCVKNCGHRFHCKIAQKDFLAELTKVIQKKNNPPPLVRDRILGLIQTWADAFRGKEDLQAVMDVYQQLKDDEWEFPPVDLDAMAPINTPQKKTAEPQPTTGVSSESTSVPPAGPPSESSHQQGSSRSGRPVISIGQTQVAKIMSEIDVMRNNMAVLNEMMAVIEPGQQTPGEKDLMYQLSVILQEMQKRTVRLCQKIQDDILLSTLLAANDEVNGVLIRYERFSKNSTVQDVPTDMPTEPTTSTQEQSEVTPKDPPPVYTETSESPLIDLGEEITTPQIDQLERDIASLGVQPTSTLQPTMPAPLISPTNPPVTQSGGLSDDEFDMFAQSRQTEYTTPSSSTYADQQTGTNMSLAAAIQKNRTTEEDSFKNLEQWLTFGSDTTTTTAGNPQGPEVATSAEFEQFLNQRAMVDPTQQPSRPRPQMQKPEEDEGLFAL